MTDRLTTARIEADPDVPIIRITRDFEATPAQLFRAHTDPDLYARWVGPDDLSTRVEHWDARRGGSWRFVNIREAEGETEEYAFRGCFHEVREDRIVQTFTFEGMPDAVSLETLSVRGPRRRLDPPARAVARRLLRGARGDARLRHGDRHPAGVREARRASRGRRGPVTSRWRGAARPGSVPGI